MLINLQVMPKSIEIKNVPAGAKEKVVWKYEYSEKLGCPKRVANGTMNLKDFVQQSADSVDFDQMGKLLVDTKKNVIDHFTVNGEVFDQTALPRNVHEYEALHNKMKESFSSMPNDIKELFGGEFSTFAKAYQNGSLGRLLQGYNALKQKEISNVELKKEG